MPDLPILIHRDCEQSKTDPSLPPSFPMSAMQSDSSSPGIENPTVGHLDIKYSTVEMFEFDRQRLSTVESGSSPLPNSVVQTWREGSVFRLLYRYGDWEDHASRCGSRFLHGVLCQALSAVALSGVHKPTRGHQQGETGCHDTTGHIATMVLDQ